MQSRRIAVIIIVVILALCVCLGVAGVIVYSFFRIDGSVIVTATGFPGGTAPVPVLTPTVPVEGGTPIGAATATPGSDATAQPTGQGPVSEDGISPAVAASMDAIQEQVTELRGLEPAGEFTRAIYSPEQLRERVINDFFAEYTPEEAADDALILSVFGLLEPDFDLIALFTELFSEQVAGFYDDETKEMVVVGSEDFGGPEKLTYAHEYNHALQDENYDFEDGLGYNDEACEIDTERCAAIQALIEGDSTLLELHWFLENASDSDMQEIVDYYNSVDTTVLDSAPAYLQEDFIFPYDEGYLFVESLFNSGGWEAVDAAYADPPVSTEQILHPEKYPADVPAPVDLPDLLPILGDGWVLLDDNVMGEWYTYLILSRGVDPDGRLPDDVAYTAAAGWGGDRYLVYHHAESGGLAMVLKATWDAAADAGEFAEAFLLHAEGRFGAGAAGPSGATLFEADAGVHLFLETGSGTIWIAAPDLAVAEAILTAVIG